MAHPEVRGWSLSLTEQSRSRWQGLLDALASELGRAQPPEVLAQSALFFCYLAQQSGSAEHQGSCERLLKQAQMAPPDTVSLAEGLAGLGWITAHLRAMGVETPRSASLLRSIDRALLRFLEDPCETFELLYGLAGVGVYAVERGNRDLLAAVVRQLAAQSKQDARGTFWFTSSEFALPGRPPQGYVDLGVAHGVPGVWSALAGAIDMDAEAKTAARLLEESVRFFGEVHEEARLFYEIAEGHKPRAARYAWCYGEPGVIAVLHSLGDGVPGAASLRRRVSSFPQKQARLDEVQESTICHGSAGLALLKWPLAQAGDTAAQRETADWCEKTLSRRDGTGIGGIRVHPEAPEAVCLGFMEGAVGVGLSLLALQSPVAPGWGALLGLKTPSVLP